MKLNGLVTIPEAATLLGVKPTTVRFYIRAGRLAVVRKIGRSNLLSERAVRTFQNTPRGWPKGRPNPTPRKGLGRKKNP